MQIMYMYFQLTLLTTHSSFASTSELVHDPAEGQV